MFWVISVYFNIRNTLPKSGTFLLGHPVYGFSSLFQRRIDNLYNNGTSSVHINGHTPGPIPIRCSVHQGCPLSAQLFTLRQDPLLCTLEDTLTGLRVGRRNSKTAVIAYADSATVFDTSQHDILKIQAVLQLPERE